jgi:hypothetical protein
MTINQDLDILNTMVTRHLGKASHYKPHMDLLIIDCICVTTEASGWMLNLLRKAAFSFSALKTYFLQFIAYEIRVA